MAELKTKKNKASVSKYISSISDKDRKADCKKIYEIMKEVSGKKPAMWGSSLVGFGVTNHKYASGREVEWLTIGFSNRKNAISLYLTCDLNDFEKELKELGEYKRGVGCLYIKNLSDVKMTVLKKLIKKAYKIGSKI